MRTIAISLVLASGVSRAADAPPPSGCHTQARAGCSDQVAWYAKPGLSPKETGGWVGGGKLCRGRQPGPNDGTWGWDYVGKGKMPGRFFLNWFPNCARQPKPGPYKIDGPEVVDVFAIKPVKRAVENKKEGEQIIK